MKRNITTIILSLIIVGLPMTAWWQREQIFETVRLRNYNPPERVVKLADDTTMTASARRLFYVYKPSLEERAEFNKSCGNQEQTIVLGCYVQHDGIYLYNISDPRLHGVIEVTAAHEMLHAQYGRLSGKEKARIDKLTLQVLGGLKDKRVLSTIENYRRSNNDVVPNELHSILATEVQNLPPELEQYYARYFSNRQAVVSLAHSYTGEFTRREQRVNEIDAKLKESKLQIDNYDKSLARQEASLNTQFKMMQRLKQSGQIEEYNNEVPMYNSSASEYNRDINRQRALVDEYNSMVEERNTLATEENQLIKAMDSRQAIDSQ